MGVMIMWGDDSVGLLWSQGTVKREVVRVYITNDCAYESRIYYRLLLSVDGAARNLHFVKQVLYFYKIIKTDFPA